MTISDDDPDSLEDQFPSPDPTGRRTNCVFAALAVTDEEFNITALDLPNHPPGQTFQDLTGRLPVTSNRGNQYILVVYDYDSNSLLLEPLKSRLKEAILAGYKKIEQRLKACGCDPQFQRLDNEASTLLMGHLEEEEVDYQLVPPNKHRANLAERGIRMVKGHGKSIRYGADSRFPKECWCRTLPQWEMTVNMLRGSRLNPKHSAYEHVYGRFDYTKTPIAPVGTRVMAHLKPEVRGSWDDNAEEGFYVGPAMKSYRCYRVYFKST